MNTYKNRRIYDDLVDGCTIQAYLLHPGPEYTGGAIGTFHGFVECNLAIRNSCSLCLTSKRSIKVDEQVYCAGKSGEWEWRLIR